MDQAVMINSHDQIQSQDKIMDILYAHTCRLANALRNRLMQQHAFLLLTVTTGSALELVLGTERYSFEVPLFMGCSKGSVSFVLIIFLFLTFLTGKESLLLSVFLLRLYCSSVEGWTLLFLALWVLFSGLPLCLPLAFTASDCFSQQGNPHVSLQSMRPFELLAFL